MAKVGITHPCTVQLLSMRCKCRLQLHGLAAATEQVGERHDARVNQGSLAQQMETCMGASTLCSVQHEQWHGRSYTQPLPLLAKFALMTS